MEYEQADETVKERNSVQRWRALPTGWFKCNTDGAFTQTKGKVRTG
jgi:hypothetical protein